MKIACHLPDKVVTNAELASAADGWTPEKIYAKTGIRERRVASAGETALDLAEAAVRRLFAETGVAAASVDFLVYCTQSPERALPSSACLLQARLGLPTACGALAIDHGCSGFVYALALAKGLLAGGLARRVLLVTSETYSRYLGADDRATRTIFGDGAAAALVGADDLPRLGAFVFGTDGAGADRLTVRGGRLVMDGPEMFNFALEAVPKAVEAALAANGLAREAVDLFVFHQANRFMLDTLRTVCGLPREKFHVDLEATGNTVSASIPIALRQLQDAGRLAPGMRVMLVGFGVGLSWGATVVTV